MSRNKIIISLTIIVAVAIVTPVTLYVINNVLKPASPSVSTVTTPDLEEDYGACDLLTVDSIKEALGTPASSLQAGFDTGRVRVSTDSQAQNCVYGLNEEVTAITEEMLTDSFYTTVYLYGTDENKTLGDVFYEDADEVEGVGDKAGFSVVTNDVSGYVDYELRVDYGLRYFSFSIRLSSDSAAFIESSAKSALTELADSVDYETFKDIK
jgi:hypothetical protein